MKYVLLILFLHFFSSIHNFCFTQEPGTTKTITIDEVIITGNEVTENEIIIREIESKEGTALDLITLKEDVERLNNLKLFTRVEVIPVPVTHDRMKLIFDVEETFYIIPIPQGGIKEGSLKKVWAGLRLNWRNFRGRNEELSFSFGLGYEPFVRLSYSVPWITNDRYFVSGAFSYSRNYNIIFDSSANTVVNLKNAPRYSVDNFGSSLTFGKKLDKVMSLSTSVAYNVVKLSEFQNGRTNSPEGTDTYTSLHTAFTRDTRDLFAFPLSGTFLSLQYSKFGIANRNMDFNRVSLDARRYILIKLSKDYSITLANRFLGIISFGGTIPKYLNESYGFGKNIRGWDDSALEGENLFGEFIELRIPVIQPFYVEGEKMPLVRKVSFLKKFSYQFGLYVTPFFDVGGVWNKTDRINKVRFRNGYGIGLNAVLPFNFIGRGEIAFRRENDKFHTELIFNLGASF